MAPLERDYTSNLKELMYASKRGARKSGAYTLVCEHFEPIRNTGINT